MAQRNLPPKGISLSDERVTASVKRDHIHLMNRLFRWDEATQKWVAQPDVFFGTPNIEVDMGNFVGALNWYEHEQYPSTGGGTDPVPAGTFGPVIVADQMFSNEQALVKDVTVAHLFAVPCVLPAGPWARSVRLDMSSSEFQSQPTTHQVCFSRVAGDFTTMGKTGGEGNSPTAHIDDLVAAGFKPDETVYFNLRFWSTDLNRISTAVPVQRIRIGGHWPS